MLVVGNENGLQMYVELGEKMRRLVEIALAEVELGGDL